MRKRIAAVVGGVRAGENELETARQLGELLVQRGFRVVTGGLGGVMRAVSEGARSASSYRDGDVLGVLPTYSAADANEFVDIAICTGLNHARNVVVVATAAVVLAVGGGSGTLSEIALAWQLGRPIIAVGASDGWASRIAGTTIDDRRQDKIHGPLDAAAAVELAAALASDEPKSEELRWGR